MAKVTFGKSVLQVEGLEVKYDIVPVSSSLARLIGDKDSASIVQQLYYWLEQGYGEVIEGVRWIYKPVKEWIEEVFPTYTSYQLGKMMKQLSDRGIIRREKLFTKHQIQRGDRFWWQPKNQTYYYSLNYEKLQELADNLTTPVNKGGKGESQAETLENSVFLKTQILSNSDLEHTKDFDCSKDNTDITSIENNSKDKSHPTLPCESENQSQVNQEENLASVVNSEIQEIDSANPKAIAKKSKVPQLDEKINQNNSTDISSNSVAKNATENVAEQHVELQVAEPQQPTARPRIKTSKGTKSVSKRAKLSPWKDEEEFKAFYRALIKAVPIVANARSAQGLTQTIIRQLRSGIPHTYWDDFAAGMPIGFSTKPEWEIEPGVPYPMFIEYLTEKIIKGNNTQSQEQARNEVFRILSQPRQATAFWGQFKRSVVNVSEQLERDRALGVSNPSTPVWTRERPEPSIEEAAAAGKKIVAVNDAAQAAIESARTPQLESKNSPSLSQSLDSATQTSPNKSEEIFSSLDPWNENGKPENGEPEDDKPALSMREMLAERGVKGFCKPMPKVSRAETEAEAKAEAEAEARARMNRKVNISKMSLAEINELLTDPIMRKELTPQIIFNDKFEAVTDYLGEILSVNISQEYLNSGGT